MENIDIRIMGSIVKMTRSGGIISCGVFLVLLFSTVPPFAEEPDHEYFLPGMDMQLSQVIESIFQGDFATADSMCRSLLMRYPDHPAGYFMKGIWHWKKGYFLKNYNAYNDSTLFWLKKAVQRSRRWMHQNPRDPLAYFFAGGAYGYEGSVYARRKSWLRTGKAAYLGIRALKKSLQLDSSLYDVYYGTGLYHVLAGHQPGVVKWLQKLLPIPAGDSRLGVEHLKLASEKGRFTSLAARAALAFAYVYYEKKYREAIQLLTPLVQKYPNNFDFLTTLINAYFYRELTHPVSQWQPLQTLIDHVRRRIHEQNVDFQPWWLDKFEFIEGYEAYMLGDFETARTKLSDYCRKYSHKGASYLSGLGYLTLGKIYDLSGNREQAIIAYKKVFRFENMGNEKELATSFLSSPFHGETYVTPFRGTYVDLPDRP